MSESDEHEVPKGVPNAWRCSFCSVLVYNTLVVPVKNALPKIVPRPGAPTPRFVSGVGNLCSLCAHLYWTISLDDYWRKLHEEYEADLANRKISNKKLRFGGDYMQGS